MGDDVPTVIRDASSLAINVGSAEEVDAADRRGAGCRRRAAGRSRAAEWGGYTGYFADPDGHAWEVAHNPGWPLGEDGLPRIS